MKALGLGQLYQQIPYLLTNDQSQDNKPIRSSPEQLECFQQECEKETKAERFSAPFTDLPPDMTCMRMIVMSW